MAPITLTLPEAKAIPSLPDARPSLTAVLALDLGTTTGWALEAPDGLITSGTVSFRPARYDGGGMRYLRFVNWLTELEHAAGPIGAIHYEEVRRHIGTDVTRPTMRFVAIKTAEQQSVLMLHKTRQLLIRQQTMLINAIRAHLAEFGIVAGIGRRGVEKLEAIIEAGEDDWVPDREV